MLLCPSSLQSTRLGLLVNNIRKKAADKALARRLKNLVRSWKEACTAPTQANPPLSHTVKPVGEPSAAVVRPPSVEPVPLVNSHNVQPAGEANRQAAPLSSALNFQAHSLTHPLHPFPQPFVGAEIETSATRPQIPLLLPPGAEPVPQAQEQCCTPPLPSSSPPKAVLHSLTVCIPLSQLPGPLVDRLRRPKERETGSHVAIVQQPSPPLPCAVDLPPNTVVLPPHSVVFPPRPLAPSPLTLPPSQPTINLVISIPLHKVAVRGAACERTLENGSSGFPCKPVGGATLNHTPSVLPKHLGFVPSSMGQESSDGICQQRVNEMHAEENSVVCWRYAWTGAEGWYSGIHGYFDHTGQWHDWTMPLPSHNDSVSVLPYVYID